MKRVSVLYLQILLFSRSERDLQWSVVLADRNPCPCPSRDNRGRYSVRTRIKPRISSLHLSLPARTRTFKTFSTSGVEWGRGASSGVTPLNLRLALRMSSPRPLPPSPSRQFPRRQVPPFLPPLRRACRKPTCHRIAPGRGTCSGQDDLSFPGERVPRIHRNRALMLSARRPDRCFVTTDGTRQWCDFVWPGLTSVHHVRRNGVGSQDSTAHNKPLS